MTEEWLEKIEKIEKGELEGWGGELVELITSDLIQEIEEAKATGRGFIKLDCDLLFEYSELSEKFFDDPETFLEKFENQLDTDLMVRPFNVPEDICGVSVGDLGVEHAGQLIVLKSVLQTATDPKGKCKVADFMCLRCGGSNKIMQDFGDGIKKPTVCQNPNCENKGPFKLQEEKSVFVDYQFADVQEKPTEIEGAQQARSKLAYLEGSDLMDKIEPGQDVVLVGIPYLIQEKTQGKRSNTFNIWIKALNIRVDEEEYYARELSEKERSEIQDWKEKEEDPARAIVNSLAPSIENSPDLLFDVKKSVCLQTVGCPNSNIDRRSTINVLLCGDPGVAKTRLAQKATSLRPRSQYASGARSSGPGLTASVVRDERTGEWLLKAGRLILASGAVLAIDDYEEMTENKGQLLEAMSVEQVSISKVINRTLPARTSVLALANPEYGRFDMSKDIHEQLPTEPAEHSRYDLIFAIQDQVSEERDTLVADKIHEVWKDGVREEAGVLPREKLKKIIAYARSLDPKLPGDHKEQLKNFYVNIRQNTQEQGKTPFTPRYFESMIRLAKAHSRLRLSEKVEEEDVEEAISLMKSSLKSLGFDFNQEGGGKLEALETGMTRGQKEKVNALWDILRDLTDLYDEGVPIGEFKEEAEAEGIEDEFVSEFLEDEIRSRGNLSWVDDNHIRVVNPKW